VAILTEVLNKAYITKSTGGPMGSILRSRKKKCRKNLIFRRRTQNMVVQEKRASRRYNVFT